MLAIKKARKLIEKSPESSTARTLSTPAATQIPPLMATSNSPT